MDIITVGIDVSKDRLDIAVRPSEEVFAVERNAADWTIWWRGCVSSRRIWWRWKLPEGSKPSRRQLWLAQGFQL